MQRLEIDCQTKKVAYVDLTPDEETNHLQEANQRRILAAIERRRQRRQEMLQAMVELREMNFRATIFTAQEIAVKQAVVDALLAEVG